MADHTQEAERAEFESWLKSDTTFYSSMRDQLWAAWQASRRAVAADTGVDGLPPLPEDRYSLWLQHGKVVNCFTHGCGDPAIWDHDKHWEKKGYSRAPLYTAEQARQAQREAVAAASNGGVLRAWSTYIIELEQTIADLRAELASRGAAQERNTSIDTREFRKLLDAWGSAAWGEYDDGDVGKAHAELIAHIDAWGARPAPLAYIPAHVMESLRMGCTVATTLSPKAVNGCTEPVYGR